MDGESEASGVAVSAPSLGWGQVKTAPESSPPVRPDKADSPTKAKKPRATLTERPSTLIIPRDHAGSPTRKLKALTKLAIPGAPDAFKSPSASPRDTSPRSPTLNSPKRTTSPRGSTYSVVAEAENESVGVHVGMRMRPMVGHEAGQQACLRMADGSISLVMSSLNEEQIRRHKTTGPWCFDTIMDSSDRNSEVYCDNDGCYNQMGRPLVEKVLKGYNACLFCYGQTGTGKTATIMGYPELGLGLLPRMLGDLCEKTQEMREEGCTVSMSINMLEVYNERIHDLLIDRNDWPKVHIKTGVLPTGIRVTGASSRLVESLEDCMEVLEEGNSRKTVAMTAMNPASSRGHLIFKLVLEKTDYETSAKTHTEVYFADLAGHENIKETQVEGDRLIELRGINSSLMYLQRAIHSLATSRPTKAKGKVKVNYSIFRNSELTLLLANGLTGNSSSAVICTLSPAVRHFDTSLSSIEFALECKGLKMDVHSNVVVDTDMVIKNLTDQVHELKLELVAAREQASIPAAIPEEQDDLVNSLRDQVESLSDENQTLKDRAGTMQGNNEEASGPALVPEGQPAQGIDPQYQIKLLGDENQQLRERAETLITALEHVATSEGQPELVNAQEQIKLLGEENHQLRERAETLVAALEQVSIPAVVPERQPELVNTLQQQLIVLGKENHLLKERVEHLTNPAGVEDYRCSSQFSDDRQISTAGGLDDRESVKKTFTEASRPGNGKLKKDACVKLISGIFPLWSEDDLTMFFETAIVDSSGLIDASNWLDWIYDAGTSSD